MLYEEDFILKELEEFRIAYQPIAQKNHKKVLKAFQTAGITTEAFNGSTGYGYNDYGRKKLNFLYSLVFKGEDALVSSKFASGTHAIYSALNSLLIPGDKFVSLTGTLYDTMDKALKDDEGLIKKYGITYEQWDLYNGNIDCKSIEEGRLSDVKLAIIQRSRGYSNRKSITIAEIIKTAALIRKYSPKTIIFVDNCYGEFVEDQEPLEAGADIMAGSLIKNPGGTIALSGGYVVGRKDLISKVADNFTVPGIGREIGCESSEALRLMYQGLFLAPKLVEESLLSAHYLSLMFKSLGYKVDPDFKEKKTDIIQSIYFDKKEDLILFVQTLQRFSPVDSQVKPIPWDMPGYDHQVIMASGSFISGSSSELSADAPIKEPYVAYFQGGVSWHYSKIAIDSYRDELIEKKRDV
ncbi:MAG: methionine gamma-lyase family protein [Fusobacteria bacterium]|nr:methionine gamma-lyase family protein [Fusobacteriota bacterium]